MEDRPQHVVVIDTNAPVTGQIAADPSVSNDAAVDMLRVDVLDDANQIRESQTFVVPDPRDWPVSFGIASSGAVRLRLTAFRGIFTSRPLGGEAVPLRETRIDRAVELPPPSGVSRVLVVLDADCRGIAPSFLGAGTTCIDAPRPAAPPTEGLLEAREDEPTRVGEWPFAREVPCRGSPRVPGARCIPGGFAVLGDGDLVDTTPDPVPLLPLRPVVLSPFWMDEREFTVGRYRELRGRLSGAPPRERSASQDSVDASCTYRGPRPSDADDHPLNCIDWASAAEACEADGGRLPTEAEWEYVARGRGQRRTYPWGESAECCTASLARGTGSTDPLDSLHDCPGVGVEATGSHPASPSCGGRGDVSRDGILDLGGSLREYTSDAFEHYSAGCWQEAPLLRDPSCPGGDPLDRAERGGNWTSSLRGARAPLRILGGVPSPLTGFRCAYEDAP